MRTRKEIIISKHISIAYKYKLIPDTEGSSRFRIPSEARDSKAKITRGRGLTDLDQPVWAVLN